MDVRSVVGGSISSNLVQAHRVYKVPEQGMVYLVTGWWMALCASPYCVLPKWKRNGGIAERHVG